MLLDLFEKELHLPTILIQQGYFHCIQIHVIGDENEFPVVPSQTTLTKNAFCSKAQRLPEQNPKAFLVF